MSQQATTLEYEPADGVSTTVGGVAIKDIFLITKDGAGSAKLSGLANNPTGGDVAITVGTSAKGGQKFTVPARSKVRLDGKTVGTSTDKIKAITLTDLKDGAGESTTLAFTSASSGQVHVTVPVLLDQHPYGTHTVEHPKAEGAEEGGGH